MRILLPIAAALATSGCMSPTTGTANARGGQRDPVQLLEKSDLNGDGRITRPEYADARARMFDRLDRNRDGRVSQADAPQGRFARRSGGGGRLKSLAGFMDTNGDGQVTRAEFVDGPAPIFDRADTDRDGVVTRNELSVLRQSAPSGVR